MNPFNRKLNINRFHSYDSMTKKHKFWLLGAFLLGTIQLSAKEMRLPLELFNMLDSLKAGKDTTLNIVHLGDSHIQGGFFPGEVMRLLQEEFGNAGRGWVAPYKLGKSNQPFDYAITSGTKEWVLGRCVQTRPKCPLGPGGMGIQTSAESPDFLVKVSTEKDSAYLFRKAILYRSEKSLPMLPAECQKDSVMLARAREKVAPDVVADTFRIKELSDHLYLKSDPTLTPVVASGSDAPFENRYYGFTLTNEKPGILYHTVGVNGARFVNYSSEAYVRQLALLQPDLLILSMGTNETFEKRFLTEQFKTEVQGFLNLVKTYMPHTAILLTTPPECFKSVLIKKKKTYVRNVSSEYAAKALVDIARKEGIACYDLFTESGGKGSGKSWFNQRLMAKDHVHFTRAGYEKQGRMLFDAIMNAYRNHHKNKPSEPVEEPNTNLSKESH